MTSLHMRVADAADAAALATLINDAFRPERFYIEADRTNPAQVASLMTKGKFFLLEDDAANLAACVYAELRGDAQNPRGYLGLLAVNPAHQREGLGSRLIAVAEDHCRSAGCSVMDLTFVNLRTQLPAYYRRFGYEESGTLPFPPEQVPKVPIHLVQMSKAL